jgi:SulP family sulfate permease
MLEQIKSRHYFNLQTIREDLSAGLVLGIESIPDGMASGLLAAVNPIYGVYGYMVGVTTGALFTSSVFMAVQATGAMSLVVASVPQVALAPDPNTTLFALAILTGILMAVAGLLKLGSLIRFVPNSVMVGFINAVAVLIILGQLDDFTGYSSIGANKVGKAINLFFNLDQVDLPTMAVGLLTIFLILTLVKAYGIAWYFMHLKDEKTWFRRSIVWPVVFLICYLAFFLLYEGDALAIIDQSLTRWSYN